MFVHHTAAALAIAITAVSRNSHGVELTDDSISGKIATACDSAQLLQASGELYKADLVHLAAYKSRNAKLLQMWVVSAATSTGQAKLGFALLQALGAKRMTTAAEALTRNLQHFLKFKQTVDLKTGILAQHAARRSVTDGTPKVHAGAGFNGSPVNGGEKTGLVDDQTIVTANICKAQKDNTIGKNKHSLRQPLNKAFYLTPDTELTQLKYSAAISIACGGTGTIAWKSSGTDIGCSDSSSAPKLKAQLKTSKLFAPESVVKQNIGKADDQTETCAADYPEETSYWPSNQEVANAACQYKNKKQATPPDLETITLSGLKADTEFKALIRQTLNGKEPSAAAEVDAINKIYGTDESAFKKTFITDIADSTAKLWESDGLKDKKYSELSSTKHLEEAYAHAVAQNIHNKAEKAKTLISKAKEEECKNKGNTATECGSDKCELKEGKCVEKEEVKVENDGKTTNTTGSSSFVINKAPLWLAVLLF